MHENSAAPKTSYFMDKIFPGLVTAALAAGFGLVGVYFTVQTLSDRVSALEVTAVRKDVLTEQLLPMQRDITEMKADIKSLLRDSIKETTQ